MPRRFQKSRIISHGPLLGVLSPTNLNTKLVLLLVRDKLTNSYPSTPMPPCRTPPSNQHRQQSPRRTTVEKPNPLHSCPAYHHHLHQLSQPTLSSSSSFSSPLTLSTTENPHSSSSFPPILLVFSPSPIAMPSYPAPYPQLESAVQGTESGEEDQKGMESWEIDGNVMLLSLLVC